MKTHKFVQTAAGLLLLAAFAIVNLNGCGGQPPQPTGKPVAVATIFAYYDALRAIGGDDITAQILLPPGWSPHDYQASVQDKSTVMKAQLIVKNGLDLDPWIDNLSAMNKTARILSIGDSEKTLKTEETKLATEDAAASGPASGPAKKDDHEGHDHAGHDHGHADGNPHIWLDPTVQMRAAEKIRDALIKIDPAKRDNYIARTETYIAELKKLDADFKASVATFKYKEFIGFHSAYDYLAHRYGLVQVASIAETGGGGLNPAQIKNVVEIIRERKIPVIFSENAFDSRQAENVTRQTGVKMGTLQPLETYDNLNDTYVSLMRQNLASLEKYMKE